MPRRPSPIPNLMPILMTVLGIALFSIMDAFMKRASMAGGVYATLLLRCLISLVPAALLWRARGGRWPKPAALRLHALRGSITAVMAGTFFYGLVRTPMAQAMALSFIAPLLALYLASVQLGEKIHRAAIAGSVICLVGVVAIALDRIGQAAGGQAAGGSAAISGEALKGIVAVLVSAVFYAWNLVLQRRQAQIASPLEVVVFQNLFAAATLLPALPLLWHMPGLPQVAYIAGAAALATGALLLLSWAYARAEAQVLVPIEYSAFIWAALMGWLWFAEALTMPTLLGVALIVAGCWIGTQRGKRAEAG